MYKIITTLFFSCAIIAIFSISYFFPAMDELDPPMQIDEAVIAEHRPDGRWGHYGHGNYYSRDRYYGGVGGYGGVNGYGGTTYYGYYGYPRYYYGYPYGYYYYGFPTNYYYDQDYNGGSQSGININIVE